MITSVVFSSKWDLERNWLISACYHSTHKPEVVWTSCKDNLLQFLYTVIFSNNCFNSRKINALWPREYTIKRCFNYTKSRNRIGRCTSRLARFVLDGDDSLWVFPLFSGDCLAADGDLVGFLPVDFGSLGLWVTSLFWNWKVHVWHIKNIFVED